MKTIKNLDVKTAVFIKRLINFYIRKRTSQSKDFTINLNSVLIEKGRERDLYRTKLNHLFWLKKEEYIDNCIIETGYFESELTRLVNRLIKKDNIVLDIGANIGYYSVMFSKLVGPTGEIVCFEPTKYYSDILKKNLNANSIENVTLFEFGLSNKEQELEIYLGDSTASVHNPGNFLNRSIEKAKFKTLDAVLKDFPLRKIDFIKLDIDGHEPYFFEGAWETLDKFDPVVFLEVSHLHYLEGGVTAWDFYEKLKAHNYLIYHENNLDEIKTKEEFLIKCGNFAYSTNIIISKKPLNI